MACLFARLRDKATIGVEQNRPICTPGVQNWAVSDATARSQLALAQAELLARTQSMDKEVQHLQAEVQRLADEQRCRTDMRTHTKAAVLSGMEIADLQVKARRVVSTSSGKAQLQHFKHFLARSALKSSSNSR